MPTILIIASIVQIASHGPWATISFTDNGNGLTETDKQQIFTLFYRGANENQTKGHGIGMTLAKKDHPPSRRHRGPFRAE